MTKPILWLVLSEMENAEIPAVLPTIAWMSERAGALVECYLEAPRDGELFGRYGSTVLGGAHHLQFNYLHQVFDVRAILYGSPEVFLSSLRQFNTPILARADTPADLYRQLLPHAAGPAPAAAVVIPGGLVPIAGQAFELAPYCYPEIFYRQALGFTSTSDRAEFGVLPAMACFTEGETPLDAIQPDDTIGSVTLRIARRWKSKARGVVFGDPAAVLSQLPAHCREARIAVFAPVAPHPLGDLRGVKSHPYMEYASAIAGETAELAVEVGNRVIVGRQTGDADIFVWSKYGVCIQIIDPNRPAFQVLTTRPQVWVQPGSSGEELEPTDEELRRYVVEGKRLSTLIIHSGEMAHNEAMLNLCELACWSGLKMGLAVHDARYTSCPQLWELLATSRERGGFRGLIEPVLHASVRGVLAECHCPPELLTEHCRAALAQIEQIAGKAGTPRGYYAFCDTDTETLTDVRPDLFEAVAAAGLEYFISSARPGRNLLLQRPESITVLNQTCRTFCSGSPFVRINGIEGYGYAAGITPGWFIATLDAPVAAFMPNIWRHGSRYMQLFDAIMGPENINVTPRTISRYARILNEMGLIPEPPAPKRS